MKKIEPMFVYDEKGKKTGVMINPSDFEIVREELEDYYDYKMLKRRSKKKYKTFTPEEVLAEILGKK